MDNKKDNSVKMLILIISIIVICIGIIIYLIFRIYRKQDKTLRATDYTVTYDNTWNIEYVKENESKLKHTIGSNMIISSINLENEQKDRQAYDLLDAVESNILKQNENCKLIARQSESITKIGYDSSQMLFENNEEQIYIGIIKGNDKVYIVQYIAKNEYFDILLDSVKNIIWSFELISNIGATDSIDIQTTSIKYGEDMTGIEYQHTKDYEIFNNNYNVKYSLPKVFNELEFNNQNGIYNWYYYNDVTNSIKISTNIYFNNIFELLTDIELYNGINKKVETLKNNKNVSNVDLSTERVIDNVYISKIAYTNKNTKQQKEEIYLYYALDELTTFVVCFDATKIALPKDLVYSVIDTISYNKYGEYIYKTIENDMYKKEFKIFHSSNHKKYNQIYFYLPLQYNEQNLSGNMYVSRYFEAENQGYKLKIDISNLISKYEKDVVNDFNGKQCKFIREINLNDRVYKMYGNNNEETSTSIILLTKIDGDIIVSINLYSDKEAVNINKLEDITKFNVEVLDYK